MRSLCLFARRPSREEVEEVWRDGRERCRGNGLMSQGARLNELRLEFEPLKFSAADAVTFPSATSPQTAASLRPASQQGWSLSSNKPLSHRLMPADDKSPPYTHQLLPPPTERVGPTVCLIKPKGRDATGHTARRERQAATSTAGKKNNPFSFSSIITLIPGVRPSVDRA